MIEGHLGLVLDVFKTTHSYIKIKYTCNVNTFDFRATLTTANFVALIHTYNEHRKEVIICYYSLIEVLWTFGVTARVSLSLPVVGLHEHAGILTNAFLASALAPILIHYERRYQIGSTVGRPQSSLHFLFPLV